MNPKKGALAGHVSISTLMIIYCNFGFDTTTYGWKTNVVGEK